MPSHIVRDTRRKAATAVLVVTMVPLLLGVAALTVDVGAIYNTRADLQNLADAAALAGAHALATDVMMSVRMRSGSISEVTREAQYAVERMNRYSTSFAQSKTVVDPTDVSLGWIDLTSGTSALRTDVPADTFNAVQVTVRRTDKSMNGPLKLFFAPVLGKSYSDVVATAVAALDDRFVSYDSRDGDSGVLPLSMDIEEYERQLTAGGDSFSYDPVTDAISAGADGIREVVAFPGAEAPGNFGLLNIGTPNQSAEAIGQQIEIGVSPEDFELETGSSELAFADADGGAINYEITGNPGLKASLEDSLKTRVGQVIAFFVHDKVDAGGANAVYRVVGMRFGRVMDVSLRAGAASRGLWIQPITYDGPGADFQQNVASSGAVGGRIVLAR